VSEKIHQSKIIASLEPRREPYWAAPISKGRFIGFRKIDAQRGSWIARARDEDTGKQRYRALGELSATLDYDKAVKAAREWFASLDQGVTTKERVTVESACREYVDNRRQAKGDKCADDAEWRFKRAVYDTTFGRTELARLRATAIRNWREGLGTKDDKGRHMTKAGQNRMMTTVRAALNLAVTNRQVAATAAQEWRDVKQHAKADGRRKIYLDVKQRRALLAAVTGAVRDLMEAAMVTGARPGELASAERGAFDGRLKTLKLNGKTGPRTVLLAPAAVTLFERVSKSKLPTAPLLARDDGKPWSRAEWTELVRDAAKNAVVEGAPADKDKLPLGVSLYTLRHSFITQAISDGMTTLEVARLTGTSLMMIDKNYGHLVQDVSMDRLAAVQMV
jgi:site-specific recombinase XerD